MNNRPENAPARDAHRTDERGMDRLSPERQVSALEEALLQRARDLAETHRKQGETARQRIMDEAAERQRQLEEREETAADALADREYKRLVQAGEVRLQTELDRLRWALVESSMDGLRARLKELVAHEERYRKIFSALLEEATDLIEERDTLVAIVNDADHRRFSDRWQELAAEAVPHKNVSLSPQTGAFSGGVMVTTKGNRVRVDNSFEGRMERLESELQRVIFKTLFASESGQETLRDA